MVRATLDGQLARFKHPKKIVAVTELPRNTMGKVQKNVLRETYKDVFAAPVGANCGASSVPSRKRRRMPSFG